MVEFSPMRLLSLFLLLFFIQSLTAKGLNFYKLIIECTFEDFGSSYTECENDKRLVVFYKKNNCEGGIPLPPSTNSIPCNMECRNGQFLKAPLTTCQDCPSGTFSFSVGERINFWKEENLPKTLRTSCQPKNKCKSWSFQERFTVTSEDSKESILEYNFEIVRETSKVTIGYKMDVGNMDIYIDGEKKSSLPIATIFQQVSFPLTKGYHKLEVKYENTKGLNRAYINKIEVYGSKFYETFCTPCPEGYYSEEKGSFKCNICPKDHFSTTGSNKCSPCPQGEYSFEGASKCYSKKKCSNLDYYQYHSPCKYGQRSLIYQWLSPKLCEEGDSLPHTVYNRPCLCPIGKYKKGDQCLACDKPGTYLSSSNQCEKCSKGTAGIKQIFHSNFDEIPEKWKTECHGICPFDSKGWRITTDKENSVNYLESGPFSEISILKIPIQLYTKGNISFEYQMNIPDYAKTSSLFNFYVNNSKIFSFSNQKGWQKFDNLSLTTGYYLLTFSFEKFKYHDSSINTLIKSIRIIGEKEGGATECYTCPAGFYCPENSDQFIPCKPGESSKRGEEQCEKCPADTFSHLGGTLCLKCGEGTHSKPGSSYCEHDCTYTDPKTKKTFDLRPLKSNFYGPFDSNTDNQFYFNLCGIIEHKDFKSIKTYSLLKTEHKIYDLGGVINFKKDEDGLQIEMKEGEECIGKKLETIINIKCDPQKGKGEPFLITEGFNGNNICQLSPIRYIWNSVHGCIPCTKDDIDSIQSECKNGKMKISYFYKQDHHCYGGELLPQEKIVICKECSKYDYTYIDSKCVNGKQTRTYIWKQPKVCSGGIDLPKEEIRKCNVVQMDYTTFLAFIIILVLLFILFLIVIYYLQRKRPIQTLETNTPIIPDDDDDNNNRIRSRVQVIIQDKEFEKKPQYSLTDSDEDDLRYQTKEEIEEEQKQNLLN